MKNTKKVRSVIAFGLVVTIAILAAPWTVRAECPPPECQTGVRSPGYWMNHPEAWPEWANVYGITIGQVTYTKEEAIALMKAPTKGDKTYTLFQALVAARLNVTLPNNCNCIWPTIQGANWILWHYPLGSGVKGSSEIWQECGEAWYCELDAYNNGLLCTPAQE